MKNKWPATVGLSLILTGAACLVGCSSIAHRSGSTGTNNGSGPATVAYAFSYPRGQINEYSTVNGSLLGTLTVPTPYTAQQFATDGNGQIYVTGCGPTNDGEVFVFPPNSTGAATPSSAFELGSCGGGINDIYTLVVDPAGQYLYVQGPAIADVPQTVYVFPVAANGPPVPVRTLQLSIGGLGAVDADGNIYTSGVAYGSGCNGVVSVYGPTASGTDAPISTITIANEQATGVAVDASGDIFVSVTNCQGTDWAVEEFAAGANGAATPINTINLPALPAGAYVSGGCFVRLDAASNIFASLDIVSPQPLSETAVIYGFAPTATGQATPTVTISDSTAQALFALN